MTLLSIKRRITVGYKNGGFLVLVLVLFVLLFASTVQAETRLSLGAGVTNFVANAPDGTWWQSNQPHGFDTLSFAMRTGIEQTITEHWYVGAGYVRLGNAQAWTKAVSDDEFFGGKPGKADKYLNAVDRVQGAELYIGYQWQIDNLRPYLTAGVAQFWHTVTQTHDTEGYGRSPDVTLHGTIRSWRMGGGMCYKWVCGEVTYYKGATPGTNYPIATDAFVPMLVLNVPISW